MSDSIITVENLSKSYMIHHQQTERYTALRDVLTNGAKNIGRRLLGRSNGHRPTKEEFWALKDVSFEVKRGERVGIIGRNGAGKSTLLKILSRITEPTAGRVRLRGRVASLLEVGTGFHPELTGRENIYLNGAILGMSRAEIKRKFDEIVAFAEVEKFLDTPVKRYSSGMYVRLAFAVAAHLEPEILLVDEVLAVGDAAFQKKCLGKMGDVASEGRTIFFVSHQLSQIRRLCERCIWLHNGQVRLTGLTQDVIAGYESFITTRTSPKQDRPEKFSGKARFLNWEILNSKTDETNVLRDAGPVTLKFVIEIKKGFSTGMQGIALYDQDRQLIWGTALRNLSLAPGRHEIFYQLETLPLRPGVYHLLVSLYDDDGLVDLWECVPDLQVSTMPLSLANDDWAGILNLPCKIQVNDQLYAVTTEVAMGQNDLDFYSNARKINHAS